MDVNEIIRTISNAKYKNKGFEYYDKSIVNIDSVDIFEEDSEVFVKATSYDSDVYETSLYLSKDSITGECTCPVDDEGPACHHICALVYELDDFLQLDINKDSRDFINYLFGNEPEISAEEESKKQLFTYINELAIQERYDELFIRDEPKKIVNKIGLSLEYTAANQKLFLTLISNSRINKIDNVEEFLSCVINKKSYETLNSKLFVDSDSFDKNSLKLLKEYHSLLQNEKNIESTYYAYHRQNYLKVNKSITKWLTTLDNIPIQFKGQSYSNSTVLSNKPLALFSLALDNNKAELKVRQGITFDYIDELLLISINNEKVVVATGRFKDVLEMSLEVMDTEMDYLLDRDTINNLYYALRKYELCIQNEVFETKNDDIEYVFDVHGTNGMIQIYPYVKYDNKFINPLLEKDEDQTNVDSLSVNLSLRYLDKYNYIKLTDCYEIANSFEIVNFFNFQVPNLPDNFDVVINDDVKNVYVDDLTDKLGLKVGFVDDLIQMDIELNDLDLKDLKYIYDSIEKQNNFYKLPSGQIVNLHNSDVLDKFNTLETMNVDVSRLNNTNIILPRYYSLFLNSNDLKISKDESFSNLSDEIDMIKDKTYPLPKINAELREYQFKGYQWLASNYELGFGSVLADDMGLGKTLQVITFLTNLYQDKNKKKTLIIVPKALLYNWEHEFIKFSEDMKIQLVEGNKEERLEILENVTADVIITTYDLFKRDIEIYKEEVYECVVIDEAQAIKNDTTSVSRSVKELKTKHAIALSGTPIENNLLELSSLFEFVLPGYLGSKLKFRRTYEKPISQGNTQKMSQLIKLINPFILRRTKREVLKDLPDKIEEVVQCELTKEQEQIYNSYFAQIKDTFETQYLGDIKQKRIEILSLLTKLRQICCHPQLIDPQYTKGSGKMETALELINNGLLGDNKILVFSQFTSMLSIIKKQLDKDKIPYYYLDGKVSSKQRLELCNDFNNNDDIKVFLISLKAGGSGLNLTAANMVIHYDQWWNPAVMSQASDRAHRYGQKNVVQVYNLVTRKTIEEKIMALQVDKKDLVSQVLNNNNTSLTSLSDDDLKSLFQL